MWRVVGVGSPSQLNETGKTFARAEFPLNLPPNTLLLFLLQGQSIILQSESPNFTTGHMRLQLSKYSRFWILFLNCSDHLVESSWMLCPSVGEFAGLVLYWEVTMGFNLAIAVKSLYKFSLPLSLWLQLFSYMKGIQFGKKKEQKR